MEGQVEQKKCGGGMHWGCCWVPMFSGLAWAVALVSAVAAWWKTGQGIDASAHYWNALVFAVIALYGHRAKMSSCKKTCSAESGSCGQGKC